MRKRAGGLTVMALVCAGCVSTAELQQGVRLQAPVPRDTQVVVIRPTVLRPNALKNVEGLADAPQVFARSLRDALQRQRPAWASTLADAQSMVPERGIAVKTELLNIDGGSAALRFWIGLNTGATESTVQVSVLDTTGGELVTAQIANRTICPVGACVESNEDTVRRSLEGLAEETAAFIIDPAAYQKKKQSGQ
jgi:uncharacterized protein DUF4410